MSGSTFSRTSTAFVFGALTCVAVGFMGLNLFTPRSAYAQIPDSGAQRAEMIREQQITNQRLSEIAALLTEIRDQQGPSEKAKSEQKGGKKPAAKP